MKVRSLVRTIALAVTVVLIAGGMTGAWDLTINGRRTSDLDDATSVVVDLDTGSIFVAGRRQISSTNSQLSRLTRHHYDEAFEYQGVAASPLGRCALDCTGHV